ncbi:unnamed protein product [Miscanthus lutarioriparius]|uniref:Uncharacterized protein n=1 Tax=Miscanthus lutarioriparius TaxID=422564 RepID=A0A811R8H1_9POAL|nr:unnamed protein product [Miscanthus lutarioriparius]
MAGQPIGDHRSACIDWALQLAVGAVEEFQCAFVSCSWINNFILAFASSVFSFCFETWLVLEHEKQDQKQDLLFNTFWLMTFFESVSLIGSQEITNVFVSDDDSRFLLHYAYCSHNISSWNSVYQKCIKYQSPCVCHWELPKSFLPMSSENAWKCWFSMVLWSHGSFRNEDSLTMAYIGAGLALSIVAYDYQEIGPLVIVFCIFHACVGFILPSLARLRTMYLPNELRGGMMSFSLSLANAAIFIFLLQGAHHRRVTNSTILSLASYGLLGAGGCIHILRRWRKHTPAECA